MFAFELGREFKLSIAEIFAIFPNGKIDFCDKKILILDNIESKEILEKSKKLGGTIKIFEVSKYDFKKQEENNQIRNILENNLFLNKSDGKFNYSINTFGFCDVNQKEILKISKEIIKNNGFNPRFINQDFKNISSVAIIKEALVSKKTDFNFVFTKDNIYFGNTIFVQDIYSYSNRDYGKDRDMNIGMLPPKLAQIMINLGNFSNKNLYDPFVGLGTVLIEGIYMGIKNVFGSDINQKMVEVSENNLEKLKQKFTFSQKIFFQNSKYISEVDFLNEIDLIVTEGYLGEIMTKNNINFERIEKQKLKLLDLYEGFFSGLKSQNFKGNLVISFPFWEIKGKYFYFEEIYDTIGKYCITNKILPQDFEFQTTKSGSLLYKRDSQLVGREIFSLKLK